MDILFEIDEYNRTRRAQGEPVMTQRRLAEVAGVAEATVSRHVRGHYGITNPILEAYRRALRMDEAA